MLKGQKIGEKAGEYFDCPVCDNIFYRGPYAIKHNFQFSCSKKCGYELKKRKMGLDKHCIMCNKEFHVPQIAKEQQYCSRDCYFKHIRSGERKGSN